MIASPLRFSIFWILIYAFLCTLYQAKACIFALLTVLMQASSLSNSVRVNQGARRTTSAPSSTEMISNSAIASCSNEPASTEVDHRRSIINQFNQSDDVGNQSDSSNSTSSLASSPRYNERHPRAFESFRKSGSGVRSSGGNSCSSARGSFVVLGSRTSLPPLDENCPLDAAESQLSLKLRSATRSSSWTNQKILDAIDGLNTSIEDIDPCLVLGGKVSTSTGNAFADDSSSKTESIRQGSFEKFPLPKSISNLIMKSRSSGSVNPPTSTQNRESSCYNFLSGIREDEDEEQQQQQQQQPQQDDTSGGTATGIQLTITPASIPSVSEGRRPNVIARGGEKVKNGDDPVASILEEKSGAQFERWSTTTGNVAKKDEPAKKNFLTQQQKHHEQHQPQNRKFSEKVKGPLPQQMDTDSTDDVDKQRHQLQQQQHRQNSKNIMQFQCSETPVCSASDKGSKSERPRSEQKNGTEKEDKKLL